jgi:hypothetical protein
MTEVSADAGHPSDLKPERSARQNQNRTAQARRRARRRQRVVSRRLELKPEWLDGLAQGGQGGWG